MKLNIALPLSADITMSFVLTHLHCTVLMLTE